MSERYAVDFSSTDDPDLDAELLKVEDEPRTLEDIVATCRKYSVQARFQTSDGIMTIDAEGVPRLWRRLQRD